MTPFEQQLEHLFTLARKAGFRQYALERAAELEADETGMWLGLTTALHRRIAAGLAKAGASGHPKPTKQP